MFLLNPWGHRRRPCQGNLSERWADTAGARSLETRFPPSSVPNFLGDPMGKGARLFLPEARGPEPSFPPVKGS